MSRSPDLNETLETPQYLIFLLIMFSYIEWHTLACMHKVPSLLILVSIRVNMFRIIFGKVFQDQKVAAIANSSLNFQHKKVAASLARWISWHGIWQIQKLVNVGVLQLRWPRWHNCLPLHYYRPPQLLTLVHFIPHTSDSMRFFLIECLAD